MRSRIDLSQIKIRLENIQKKATKSVSFVPSDITIRLQESYLNPTMSCLENFASSYPIVPQRTELMQEWGTYAYDESIQSYKALEGELLFCSSATIKIEDKYNFNLSVLPHFLTSMRKFEGKDDVDIHFAENLAESRNMILITSKIDSILGSVEPHSIVLIDGPLVGGNASTYFVRMDNELRKRDCIPLYFVKNSDSRMIIDSVPNLSKEFNSDFHWSACCLKTGWRSAFFKYTDTHKHQNSKVFAYLKALFGFPQRIEMHTLTFEKYESIVPKLLSQLAYFYVAQGDYSNPQIRPIAIAEKYAREGIRILNIPALLGKMGFRPTLNQLRFG